VPHRLYVLLYMEPATRRVIWCAATDRPDSEWVLQQARNVSWELDRPGVRARFLIDDHDHKYGGGSDLVFESGGISVIRTPIAAPRANSHMERQVGSTRQECLDWMLILNRQHLERVLTEWFEHYNRSRPHRGLDLKTPIARSDPVLTAGRIVCGHRLGWHRFPTEPCLGQGYESHVQMFFSEASGWSCRKVSRASSQIPIVRLDRGNRVGETRMMPAWSSPEAKNW
jgi:integrase-like protein